MEPIPQYPFEHVWNHIQWMQRLTTFREVAAWDHRARELIADLSRYISHLGVLEAALHAARRKAADDFDQRSGLSKMFSSPTEIHAVDARLGELAQAREHAIGAAGELERGVAYTPDSPAQRKVMLADLKRQRKALALDKKALASGKGAIRQVAAAQAAKVGTGYFETPASRRSKKANIRHNKEQALMELTEQTFAIDVQLDQMDRWIHWLDAIVDA